MHNAYYPSQFNQIYTQLSELTVKHIQIGNKNNTVAMGLFSNAEGKSTHPMHKLGSILDNLVQK